MPDQIMTLGRQTKQFALRGRTTTLLPDFREMSFNCHFVDGATNGAPLIRVTVTQVGKGLPEQIRIQLVPPGRPEVTVSGQPQVVRATRVARRMPPQLADGNERDTSPTVVFSLNTGMNPFDEPFGGDFGEIVIDDPFPDPIPPGGGGGGASRQVFTYDLNPGSDPQGVWRMRLYNQSQDPGEFLVTLEYPETVQDLETTRVAFQLLNRAFAEVMLLMSPRLRIDSGRAHIQFDAEFRKLTGITDQSVPVNDRLNDINLETFKVTAGKDAEFGWPVILIGIDLEERGKEIALPGWDGNVNDLSIQVAFSLHLVAPPTNEFFATALVRHNGQVRPRQLVVLATVHTDPDLAGFWAHILVGLQDFFGGKSFSDTIEDLRRKLETSLNESLRAGISAYIQDALVHLVEREHAIHTLRADANNLIVEHHALPDFSRRPDLLPEGDLAAIAVLSETSGNPGRRGISEPGAAGRLVGEADPVPVVLAARGRRQPAEGGLLLRSTLAAHTLLREGEIDHIVVLMMENRSFDHMLGYLSLKGRPVRGLTGNEENSLDEGNPPYVVHHLNETQGIPSPGHDFDDAIQQIAAGQMTGFAKNYIKRNAATDPGLVMSYYTEAELPVYEFFANNFAVCDAWHSSHPGATQPNRFCALTGTAPERENFDITDDRIGYFDGTTIFDFLTTFGVDWVYAEGNIGFLRIFDRYRLDTQHVIPYRDDFNQGIADTLLNRISQGRLPAVTFIDPRFIDIPPSWDANDDLPPADVCHGQLLVKEVYEALSSATDTWPRTLLVITYDEHGGFFDHIAPPGTPAADDPSPLPRVTRHGADHLGVRVPAFLISPWVDAGAVIHTQLEHTSIIRTILERFISIELADRGVLGARAAQVNSLLPLLRSRARPDIPIAPEVDCQVTLRSRGPAARDDFHTAMRYLGLPAESRRKIYE